MAIRNELREVDPSVEWIAFGFGGGGDSFQGFESFEIFAKLFYGILTVFSSDSFSVLGFE